jgi:hypothetical protein
LIVAITAGSVPACGSPGTEPGSRVQELVISPDVGVLDLDVDMRQQLTAQALDAAGAPVDVPVLWTSSTPGIATVDQAGVTNALAPGWTTITAQVNTVVARREIHVLDANTTYVVNPDTMRLLVGQQRTLALDGANGSNLHMTKVVSGWTSSNPAVVAVDSLGVVTGVAPGAAIVGVHYAGVAFWSFVAVPDVPLPLHFDQVTVGYTGASCGRVTTGDAYCWQSNASGAIGSGEILDRCFLYGAGLTPSHTTTWSYTVYSCAKSPVRVQSPAPFASVDAGGLGCGTTADGRVYCWGRTGSVTGGSDGPAVVALPTSLRFASFSYPCGVTVTNDAWCWGTTAPGGVPSGSGPTQVQGAGIWRTVTGGNTAHRCGVTTSETVRCWGANAHGQLGTGNTVASATPVDVNTPPGERFTAAGVTDQGSCALATSGIIYCWGDDQALPVPLSASARFTVLATGSLPGFVARVCGIATDGVAYCRRFQDPLSPVATIRFRSIAVTPFQTCGLGQDGYAYCWGDGLSPVPERVPGQ